MRCKACDAIFTDTFYQEQTKLSRGYSIPEILCVSCRALVKETQEPSEVLLDLTDRYVKDIEYYRTNRLLNE